MSWFYTGQKPNAQDPYLVGPYATSVAAAESRSDSIQHLSEDTFSPPFRGGGHYHLPVQVAIVARSGVDWVIYDDGSEKLRIMP
jgi:hypothetical protein